MDIYTVLANLSSHVGVKVTWSDDIPAIGAVSVHLAVLLIAVLPVMVVNLAGALRQCAVPTAGHLPCDTRYTALNYKKNKLNGMKHDFIGIHVELWFGFDTAPCTKDSI